jgi:YegS/Rv2252/BmrU family lipid kinase
LASDERTIFLVNPASDNGATGRRWPELERAAVAAGLRGETRFSEAPGHLGTLAADAAAGGASLLVAVGGDGTINEVADGLLKAGRGGDVELAVLSRGTGTDFVRSARIPRDVRGALETALHGTTRTIDAGRATFVDDHGRPAERYFVNFAGAGISGGIARRANSSSKRLGGRVSFIVATVRVFARWRAQPLELDVDGERRSGRMLEALAMNGDYTAGGMWMSPEASLEDGLLDVVLIGDATKLDFLLTFPKIYRGRHLSHPKVELLRGRSLAVDSPATLPIVLDGEQPGTTPARFELVPKALRVRVPRTREGR